MPVMRADVLGKQELYPPHTHLKLQAGWRLYFNAPVTTDIYLQRGSGVGGSARSPALRPGDFGANMGTEIRSPLHWSPVEEIRFR